MYCPRCGSNVGAFDFCPQCGSNVKELLESLETKENTEEPAVEEAEEQASPAAEEYTVPVSETDEPVTEPESFEEEPEETADGEENTDETDALFVDYLEPYSESENSLANYKKKSKLPKIIIAVLIPVIIIVSAVLAYENHFRYTTYKVPPLSKTDEYLLEEGSVPEHTIPPKVKTPKRPNKKRLLSNINHEKTYKDWSFKNEVEGLFYSICLKDKDTVYGFAEYDIDTGNLNSISEFEPCDVDDEFIKLDETERKIFDGQVLLRYTPKYYRYKYTCVFYSDRKSVFWYSSINQPYYALITRYDNKKHLEIRFDNKGEITYIVVYSPEDDYPITVVTIKNGKRNERWYFDSDNNFVKSERVEPNNS